MQVESRFHHLIRWATRILVHRIREFRITDVHWIENDRSVCLRLAEWRENWEDHFPVVCLWNMRDTWREEDLPHALSTIHLCWLSFIKQVNLRAWELFEGTFIDNLREGIVSESRTKGKNCRVLSVGEYNKGMCHGRLTRYGRTGWI